MTKAPTGREAFISCGGKIEWAKRVMMQGFPECFKYDQYRSLALPGRTGGFHGMKAYVA